MSYQNGIPPNSGFELLDHPADIGFRAWDPSLPGLFERAAEALTSIIIIPESIEQNHEHRCELEADDRDSLLYEWLSELVFLFDADGLIFRKFSVKLSSEGSSLWRLTAAMKGEIFSVDKHQVETYVKAITLHQLAIATDLTASAADTGDEVLSATVYVDI